MSLQINPRELFRAAVDIPDEPASTLILSMRNASTLVGYCPLYEFEDLAANALNATIANMHCMSGRQFSKRVHKCVRYISGSSAFAARVSPNLGAVTLQRRYDLFLPFFNHVHEIYALKALPNWRKQSRFAACYLAEAWESELPRYQIEMLRDFDHIFVGVQGAAKSIARITARPCTFVPMGVDTLRFHPATSGPDRAIRVCNIGRRSEVTHQALLEYAEHTGSFYYYNTTRLIGSGDVSFSVTDQREHRLLLANLLKRTCYFIANRAFADRPHLTNGKDEIPARYYEGAAAGAVLIGEPPDTDDFSEQFGWTDSAIRAPFHATHVGGLIDELEADPARVECIRRRNVKESLLRHDWVYRLHTMAEIIGLQPTLGMQMREAHLRTQAEAMQGLPPSIQNSRSERLGKPESASGFPIRNVS